MLKSYIVSSPTSADSSSINTTRYCIYVKDIK